MKPTTFVAIPALAATTLAAPQPHTEHKRALCTGSWGFQYWCFSDFGSPANSAPAVSALPATSTAAATPAPSASSGSGSGGSSTGGSSGYTSGSSADDITQGTGCTELTVIFARGTSEGGNIGFVIGPPLFQALLTDVTASRLTLQGVDYPADIAGNANCGAAGGPDMADKVSAIRSQCPDTKVVLSGYSQGACVVHNAVGSQGVQGIAGAVVFGDPLNGQALDGVSSDSVLSVCRSDDAICSFGPSSGSGGHTSYGSSAQEAATFIENLAGL